MKIGICDDLYTDRNKLAQLINTYCEAKQLQVHISEYENAEELLNVWTPGSLHILFLDVYMGGLSGVQAAKKIRETDPDCAIVFTTTSSDHAMDSYEVHAADYLLKPFGAREVGEALDWCRETMADALRGVEVVSDREKCSVQLKDIVYIEVFGRVSVIHTEEGRITTNKSLTDLETEISDDGFLRCHRSYLVNMSHILRPVEDGFVMDNGDTVPLSGDGAAKSRQTFLDWSFKHAWEGR